MPQEMVDIDCEIVDETDRAYLVAIDDNEFWVPKSLSEWEEKSNKIDGTLTVARWFAEKEGMV